MKHTKMKNTSGKVVKKIRSSISRPHRTQFPLVHILTFTTDKSPLRIYIIISRTQMHSPCPPSHAYGCCHGNIVQRRKEQRATRVRRTNTSKRDAMQQQELLERDRLQSNQHICTRPISHRRTHLHIHKNTLTFASCAFSEQLIVIEETSRVRVSF